MLFIHSNLFKSQNSLPKNLRAKNWAFCCCAFVCPPRCWCNVFFPISIVIILRFLIVFDLSPRHCLQSLNSSTTAIYTNHDHLRRRALLPPHSELCIVLWYYLAEYWFLALSLRLCDSGLGHQLAFSPSQILTFYPKRMLLHSFHLKEIDAQSE